MRTVYVVQGSTGEYSDRNDWLCRAFMDEGRAEAFAAELKAEADRATSAYDQDDSGEFWSRGAAVLPEYQKYILSIDYTGAWFDVLAIDLDE